MQNSSGVIHAVKFVSLDTSILANLSQDYFSGQVSVRTRARDFVSLLEDCDYIPLICWHQFEELIKHRDDGVARESFGFLRSLPLIAWIRSSSNHSLGGIVDVLSAECAAVLNDPDADVMRVRQIARDSLLDFGRGEDALAPYEDFWLELRPFLWDAEERSREIVAISRTHQKVVDISKQTLGRFLTGTPRDQAQVLSIFSEFQRRLAEQVVAHGDKKIPDADEVSGKFYAEIFAACRPGSDGRARFDPLDPLRESGLDVSVLDPKMLMRDVLKLSEFTAQLQVAHRNFAIDWSSFRNAINPDQIPSWLIESSIRQYGQLRGEHKGSELNDRHLACLSPYCDLTFVDRQTMEDIRRAHSKRSVLKDVMNTVERVRPYERIKLRGR